MAQKKTRGKGEGSLYKDSRGLWTATIEVGDSETRKRKWIRSKDKKIVVARLREELAKRERNSDLVSADQTAEQWFTYWYENVVLKKVRPKTAAGYKSVIFGHIIPVIGKVKLQQITTAHVRRVHDRIMIAKNLSSTYALNAHHIMSAAFEKAISDDRMMRNPARKDDAPLKRVAELEALTLAEGIQVLEHVSHDDLMGARWATALLTGARRGEVLGLEQERVTDFIDLSWQLQRLSTGARGTLGEVGKPVVPANYEYRHLVDGLYLTRLKTNKSRVVPLVEPLKGILERHIATTGPNPYGLVFLTAAGRPIDPDQDTRMWRTVLAQTGIDKNVRLHDLRHTAVDMLYLAGVPEDLIMDIVGHSVRATTRNYKSRTSIDRLTAAMNQMAELYMPKEIDS